MDPIFKNFYARVKLNAIIKAILLGLISGLSSLALIFLVGWFTGISFNFLWCGIVLSFAIAIFCGYLGYRIKFYPTATVVARKADELGLEERIITMVELEGDPTYIAQRQRSDALAALNIVRAEMIKISVSIMLVISTIFATICGIGGTTVYAMYSAGAIRSGVDIIRDITAEPAVSYKVEYGVEGEGMIMGIATQKVYADEDALAVMAVPDAGYIFVGWSDGYDNAYRVDYRVNTDIEVYAIFEEAVDIDPDDNDDNNPEPDDMPPYNGEGDSGGDRTPTDKPSDDAGGAWNESDTWLDGATDYGPDLGDAIEGSQGHGGNSGIIGDYFQGIQK